MHKTEICSFYNFRNRWHKLIVVLQCLFLLLLSLNNAYAKKEQEFSTDQLWQKFSKSQVEMVKKINEALQNKNFDTALQLALQLQKQNKNPETSLASAVLDIV